MVPLYAGSGEADTSEEELHRIPKISLFLSHGGKNAVQFAIQCKG